MQTAELVAGGFLAVVALSPPTANQLYAGAEQMCSLGLVTKAELDLFVLPNHRLSLEEFLDPAIRPSDLKNLVGKAVSFPFPLYEDYRKHGDPDRHAREVAKALRAWSASFVRSWLTACKRNPAEIEVLWNKLYVILEARIRQANPTPGPVRQCTVLVLVFQKSSR